jgi:hypothetical protein
MAIKDIRLPDGSEFKIEEWLHWPLFSTFEGAANTNVNLVAFSYVVGQNVPQAGSISTGRRAATTSDTNQVSASRMNHDEKFIVFSMTYEHFAIEGSTNANAPFPIAPTNMAAEAPVLLGTNLHRMQLYFMLELMVGAGINKPMISAPMSYFGQGVGAVAASAGNALGIATGGASLLNLNYATGGAVSPQNQRAYNLPVIIDSDRVMKLKVWTPEGTPTVTQDWRIRSYLDGMKRRPVG